jgi:hypothetical protein
MATPPNNREKYSSMRPDSFFEPKKEDMDGLNKSAEKTLSIEKEKPVEEMKA